MITKWKTKRPITDAEPTVYAFSSSSGEALNSMEAFTTTLIYEIPQKVHHSDQD